MPSDFEFGSSPVRRRREPDQVPKIVFCVGVALIVVVGGLLWFSANEWNGIAGPGAGDLKSACDRYLHFGEPARPAFIGRLHGIASEHEKTPAGEQARSLAEYMGKHPEDPSFARVRAILARCK